MRNRGVFFRLAVMSAAACLLVGCGAGTGGRGTTLNPGGPKGTSADLRGGWLVAGAMPSADIPTGGSFPFGLALNLDVINGQVTGSGSAEYPCPGNGVLFGAVIGGVRLEPATVAPDGTFTLTDVLLGNNTQHTIVVKGTVPDTPGGNWSGTFTASDVLASCNGTPPPAQGGTFATQKIADLDGTFSGNATLNGTNVPISLTVALTQGGPSTLNGLSTVINDQNVINGTLQVQGVSCFKGGTVKMSGLLPEAAVLGNHTQIEFLMDDGSTVLLSGTESDTSVTKLTGVLLVVSGGACDKTSTFFTTTLMKQ